jgi:cell division septum initiation protein DivIVA
LAGVPARERSADNSIAGVSDRLGIAVPIRSRRGEAGRTEVSVTDTQTKDRAKVVLNGTSAHGKTSEQPMVAMHPGLPDQALQVLTMAQRTAEEYVSTATRQADTIRADAVAAAEQIAREAEAHARNVRREADKVLFDARAAAEQSAREAQAHVDQAARNADKAAADARAQVHSITADARANAEELMAQAHRRYENVVGSLGAKREALQQQIEALEQFDREYRSRLTAFMQGQLRALWVDQPQVAGELDQSDPQAQNTPMSEQRQASTAESEPAEGDAPEGPEE